MTIPRLALFVLAILCADGAAGTGLVDAPPPPPAPPPATVYMVDWTGAGSSVHAVIPVREVRDFLDRRVRSIDRDRDVLRAHVRDSLDAELAPVFAELDGRAPAMAEWAFRWRTSYALLRRGLGEVLTRPLDGPMDVWRGQVSAAVHERFAEIVLRGDETAWRLDAARRRWLDQAKAAAETVFAGHDLDGAAFVDRRTWVKSAMAPADERVLPAPRADSDRTLPEPAMDESRVVGPLGVRAGRPLASRAAIRLPGLLPAVAAGDAVAAATEMAAAGTAAGLAVAVAGTLAFDYLVGRADAMVSREQWEGEVRHGIEAWRQAVRTQWLAEIDEHIDRRRARVLASVRAQPLNGPPGSVRSGGTP